MLLLEEMVCHLKHHQSGINFSRQTIASKNPQNHCIIRFWGFFLGGYSNMISRRHFLQASIASAFIFNSLGMRNSAKVMAQQQISEKNLLDFKSFGNV